MPDNIQIIVTGGKKNLKIKLEAVRRLPDFEEVFAVGIIQDSDDNYASTMESIYNCLVNLGFNPLKQQGVFSNQYPATGIFIMPGEGENGALEDLCLQAVEFDPVMSCVKDFIDCIIENDPKVSKISKRYCAAYIIGKKDLVQSVGLAAHKKYWNFSSPVYSNLKDFVLKLSQQ